MVLMKDERLIPVGSLCLAAAILCDRFLVVELAVLNFVVGVLTGVALVLNLVGLYRMRKSKS